MIATLIHIDEEFETEWPRGSIYALDPPHDGEAHVLVSTCVINNVPECCIFAARPDGTVKSWAEMRGSQKGTLDFERVLAGLGYRIEVAARPLTAVDFNQLRGDELRQRLRAEAAERRLEEAERKLDAAVPPSAYAGASQPQISEIITAAFHSIPTRATRRHRRLLDAVKAYEAENERLRWVVSALRDQLRQTCTVTGWADLVSDLEKLGSVKLAMRIAFAVGKDEGARAAYADLASFTEAKAGEVAHNRHASFQRAAEGKMSMANHPAQRVEWTIDAIRQIVAKGAR